MAKVLGLNVTAQQVEFAGTVERAVQACKDDLANDVAGLAVLFEQQVAGFLVLKRRAKAPAWANPEAATVSAMRIDLSLQGKGIGSAALGALPAWVASHWPEATEITLSVDEENQVARSAYERAGFVDLGKREVGRIGWVRYMSRPVEVAA